MPTEPGNAARIDALLEATHELAEKVRGLGEHLSVSQDQANRTERQAKRSKYLTKWVAVLAAISLIGVIGTVIALAQVQDAVDSNKVNSVVNCENANQSRSANLALWTFILEASAAQNTERTPEQIELIEKIRVWVAQLYAPHDCSDLSKTYDLPPPPSLGPAS